MSTVIEPLTFAVSGQTSSSDDGVVGDDEEEPAQDVLTGPAETQGVVLLAAALQSGQQSQQLSVTLGLEAGAHTLDHGRPATTAAAVHPRLPTQTESSLGADWKGGGEGEEFVLVWVNMCLRA